jgi:peptidoglycan/LPS O-acetylase OafA/YrhL
MTIDGWPTVANLLVVSTAASTLYVVTTLLAFGATRRLAAPAPIRFMALNSLIVFLGHMPIYMALHPVLVTWELTYWSRVAVQLIVCLVLLGIISEVLVRLIMPKRLGARLFLALRGTRQSPNERQAVRA